MDNNIGDRGCASLMNAQWPKLQTLVLSTNEITKQAIRSERLVTNICVTESGQFGAIGNTNSDSASLIMNIHSNSN